MKVLIIQPWISYRGAEKTSVQLDIHLERQGHQAKIAALFVDRENPPLGAGGVDYLLPAKPLRLLCRKSKLFLLSAGPIILFFLVWKRSSDFQILNPHNLPSSWIAVLVGRAKKIPVIWTVHNLPKKVSWRERTSFFEYLLWFFGSSWLDEFFVRQVDTVIVSSLRMRQQIKEKYGLDSKIISPGIEFDFFSKGDAGKAIKRWGLGGRFVLLSACRLHAEKNQILLIRALPEIKKKIGNVFLVLAGEGSVKDQWQKEAEKLGVADRVLFTGTLPPEGLRDLYAVSDINLVASLEEPFGLTPFEALCTKTISIVSKSSGAAEIIQKEKIGVICQPTVEDFTKKIIAVHKNQAQYNKVAEKGSFWVRKEFSRSDYAEKNLAVMESVVKRRLESEG